MTQRFIVALLAACLLVVLALGWWLRRAPAPPPPPAPAATPTPTMATGATPTQASGTATAKQQTGYRLAGTVVGDAEYAVIEHPDGRSDLYRSGQVVEGLGRLVAIGVDSAAFEGEGGRVELHLLPAATPSATVEGVATEDVTPKRSRSPSPSEREPSP